jgi:adenosylcobyric acid synthase
MPAKSLMILGTSSGVGKSFVTAGFCRLFSDWGYKVAPFKAQNMSNNSYVTEEGGEIGRAQAVQAECARVKPSIHMNPVLLKPSADDGSQIVIQGKSSGHYKARQYYANREMLERAIRESYEKLAGENEIIVIEGAGSPAEVNLKQYDLVNMKMAEWAGASCLLVADIDRGGVFASLIGTLDLLEAYERDRICGLVINKFRGDRSLFDDGVKFLEEKTGKKVWGVLPYAQDLWIEEEDGLGDWGAYSHDEGKLDIAVVLLPRMSNFTDFEILRHEPSVSLRYLRRPEEMGDPDLLILPGTKSTMADLRYLKDSGFYEKINGFAGAGGRLLGICGGFQMMGEKIWDEAAVESSVREATGFGIFKMNTEFCPDKTLKRVSRECEISLFGREISGIIDAYEIHMGKTSGQALGDGGIAVHPNGRFAGTYYHGLFDNAGFRQSFLEALAFAAGKTVKGVLKESAAEMKEKNYLRLRELIEKNIDLETLRKALGLTDDAVKFNAF